MTEQTAPAAKVYERTENGTVAYVSIREGLDEINHAMMGGRREVKAMSSISRTDYAIEYKDGREVRLVRVDAPAEQPTAGEKVWSTAGSSFRAHKFNDDNRALCNKSIRPRTYTLTHDGYATRDFYAASSTWTICPRCDAK